MRILYDKDLESIPMSVAIEAVRDFFLSAKDDQVVTPPKYKVVAGDGGLRFTVGAELERAKVIGFLVYDTYPHTSGTDTEQIVAVYSTIDGSLKGLCLGSALGAIRTAAINGYAASLMAKEDIDTICVIGAGYQAYYQIKAILAVREPKRVIVCNRTFSRAEELVKTLSEEEQVSFLASEDLEKSVREADIVICTTASPVPVLESHWIKDGAYVSSIGPKFTTRHEMPLDIRKNASITVSDCLTQIEAYGEAYFLDDISNIINLEHYKKEQSSLGYQLLLMTGRSGTEVIVADRFFDYKRN